jgi:aminomethyltransferase
MTPSPARLQRTPLTEWHRTHGGRLSSVAGWELPSEFAGAAGEHLAVRARAGLFDMTHMGQIEVAGKDALAALQRMTSNDAAGLRVGQVQHSALTTLSGTFVDDVLVYRLGRDHFLLLVNAENTAKDAVWMADQGRPFGDVAVLDTSSRYALLALQGPVAPEVLQSVTGADLSTLEEGWFSYGEVAGVRATIGCTSATGETGYQVFTPPQQAVRVWEAVLAAGGDAGVVPAGLDAHDTLRLEAATRLYGNDIDETTTVLEAGLEAIVSWEKGEFNGREALAAQRASGVDRRLAGFEMVDEAIAGPGHPVLVDGRPVAVVTSGAKTPSLGKAIGLTYLPAGRVEPGNGIEIDVRGRRARARVVPLPFYKRPKG